MPETGRTLLETYGVNTTKRFTEAERQKLIDRVRPQLLKVPDVRNEVLAKYGRPALDAALIIRTPEKPEVHKCPVCDWETGERWRLQVHMDLNPRWCQERGAKKIREWARKS